MAAYHSTVKTISRSAGRSATAAAAYRAGVEITDKRTGEVHDYSRKRGVQSNDLVFLSNAPKWAADREQLWNAAEDAEKRKNSTVAREFEVALPAELAPEERRQLALNFAVELVQRHGCVADVCIHAPGKEGDQRNHHAHILLSTRRLGPDGFTEKTRELDDLKTGPKEVERWRARWAELGGAALERAGHQVEAARYRQGHLPLAKQVEAARERDDLDFVMQHENREPTRHLGPTASAIERRTGEASRRRTDHQQDAAARLLAAKEAGELERAGAAVQQSIIDLSGDLDAARADRDRHERPQEAAMPYFPPSPFDPPQDDGPSPLLLLEQQYAEAHQKRVAARAATTAKGRATEFQQEQSAARERYFSNLDQQQQKPSDETPGNDR